MHSQRDFVNSFAVISSADIEWHTQICVKSACSVWVRNDVDAIVSQIEITCVKLEINSVKIWRRFQARSDIKNKLIPAKFWKLIIVVESDFFRFWRAVDKKCIWSDFNVRLKIFSHMHAFVVDILSNVIHDFNGKSCLCLRLRILRNFKISHIFLRFFAFIIEKVNVNIVVGLRLKKFDWRTVDNLVLCERIVQSDFQNIFSHICVVWNNSD